jgi:signal peptidase II
MNNTPSGKMKIIVWIALGAALIGLDQWSKWAIEQTFRGQENTYFPVIENVFHLVFVENRGVTFGMLKDIPGWLRTPVLVIIPLGIVGLLLFFFIRQKGREKLTSLCLSLIIAGAIGNIIDRIWRGSVIDFLYFNIYVMWWPAFNVADSVIVIGTILLSWQIFRGKRVF